MAFGKSKTPQNEMVDKKDLSWYEDKYQSAIVFRNWMILISIICVAAVMFMTAAIFFLSPMRTVKPFVLEIEKDTGMTKIVKSLGTEKLSEERALTEYFVRKFIHARESYHWSTIEYNTSSILKNMSNNSVFRSFRRYIAESNPQSPINRLGTGGESTVRIRPLKYRSINKEGEQVIDTIIEVSTTKLGREPITAVYEVYLTCSFNPNLELNQTQRNINPLGFVVTSYQKNKLEGF